MEKQLTNRSLSERPRRVPVGQRSRLKVRNMDPNYHYRVVNANLSSDPERVQDLLDLGYEIVPQEKVEQVGDKRVNNPSALGSAAEVSVGQGTHAVVMRIRRDWFEEDQKAKQAEIDTVEEQTGEGADYGSQKITFTRGDKS